VAGSGVSRYLHGEHNYAVHFEKEGFISCALLSFLEASLSQLRVWRLCGADVFHAYSHRRTSAPAHPSQELAGEKSVWSSGYWLLQSTRLHVTAETMSSARHQRLPNHCGDIVHQINIYTRTHGAQRQFLNTTPLQDLTRASTVLGGHIAERDGEELAQLGLLCDV